MDTSLIQNLINPPLLFFLLGMIAVLIKSDLEIPQPLPKLFSLYLLLAIGFKGGVELHHSGLGLDVVGSLSAAVLFACIVPVFSFFLFKWKLDIYNAGALAATYGSVSAVTFITAVSFLQDNGIDYGGHMVGALALMESPAIIVGVMMINFFKTQEETKSTSRRGTLGKVLHEAFTNGSVVLILGSLLIGALANEKAIAGLKPFTDDIFKGVLVIFLLDMGLVAAKRVRTLKAAGGFLLVTGIALPIFNALLAIYVSSLLGLSQGDSLLLTILAASASYIAVPAAMRIAVPKASPGIYVPMSLAITFPFNILVGIPLYLYLIQLING